VSEVDHRTAFHLSDPCTGGLDSQFVERSGRWHRYALALSPAAELTGVGADDPAGRNGVYHYPQAEPWLGRALVEGEASGTEYQRELVTAPPHQQ